MYFYGPSLTCNVDSDVIYFYFILFYFIFWTVYMYIEVC